MSKDEADFAMLFTLRVQSLWANIPHTLFVRELQRSNFY
jgi:hypothetical protein